VEGGPLGLTPTLALTLVQALTLTLTLALALTLTLTLALALAVWKAGSVVETIWNVRANHGGGYQYRLCPLQAANPNPNPNPSPSPSPNPNTLTLTLTPTDCARCRPSSLKRASRRALV